MKKNPLVSVIIPCHNYGKYLPESVESVLDQTYENIELTILDDGSKDNTKTIAKKYVGKYSNVKYLYQPNKGIVATRNRCLEEATGEYLIMLDADDFLDKNYVEKTVKNAEENKNDIIYTNMRLFGLENRETNFSKYNIEELKNRNYIHISSLIRTEVAKKYKFDKNLDGKTHEDWDFFLNMCLSGASAKLCKSTLLHYRVHGQGRNNRAETDKGKLDYVNTYLYILRKYEMNTQHLSGKLIGEWYVALYKNLQNHKKALRDNEEQKHIAIFERNKILNSRSYSLAKKISKVYSQKDIFKRLLNKKTNQKGD